MAAVKNSRSCRQLNKRVTDKHFEKKQTLKPNHLPLQEMYLTITIHEWLVFTWYRIVEEIHLKLNYYFNKI